MWIVTNDGAVERPIRIFTILGIISNLLKTKNR